MNREAACKAIKALNHRGWTVIDNTFPLELCRKFKSEIEDLKSKDLLQKNNTILLQPNSDAKFIEK